MFPFARIGMKLLQPPSCLLLIILIGAFLMKYRYHRAGKSMIIFGFSVLYLLSTGFTANLLILPLERTYPPTKGRERDVDAVVV